MSQSLAFGNVAAVSALLAATSACATPPPGRQLTTAAEQATPDPWAATLVEQVAADRELDANAYTREYRDDGTRITVLLTRRDRPPGLRGSEPGKPNYEIVLDRAGKRVERVSVAR